MLVIIIHGGDDVGDHFNVHMPFVFSPLGNLENLSPAGYFSQCLVEIVREALDVNAPGIQIGTDGIQSLRRGVAVGYIDGVKVVLLGEPGGVEGIFKPDGRLIVCPGYALAVVLFRQFYGCLRLNFPATVPQGAAVSRGLDTRKAV